MANSFRTFEGRPLTKPHEDIEDQGLAFDLQTISHRLSRRGFFSLLGIGVGSAALAACSPGGSGGATGSSSSVATSASVAGSVGAVGDQLAEMVSETNGPYPGDGSNGPDVLEAVGVERRDIRGSIGGGATANGVPLILKMNIIDMAAGNVPMAGAAVYVWHCDAEGKYSMYSGGLEDQTYLRGVQTTDDDGRVEFTTIVPGCYEGRFPHIHFEVFPTLEDIEDGSSNVLTSQIVVPSEVASAAYQTDNYSESVSPFERTSLESDNVFGDGWDTQMPTVGGSVQSGFELSIDVPIDVNTDQEISMAGGPGGSGGPSGQGGPGGQPPAGAPPLGGPGGKMN